MASLEEKIDALTAAVKENTAALQAGGGGAAAPKTSAKTADKPKSSKPKFTAAQVQAAIVDVKDKKGADAAREIIEKYAGEGQKLAKLVTMPEHFDAAYADCQAALAGDDDTTEDEDDI